MPALDLMDLLEVGDLEYLEDAAGVSINDLELGLNLTAKTMLHLIYVIQRKTNPALTLDEIRKIKLSDLPNVLATITGADADPESAGHVLSVPETAPMTSPSLSYASASPWPNTTV